MVSSRQPQDNDFYQQAFESQFKQGGYTIKDDKIVGLDLNINDKTQELIKAQTRSDFAKKLIGVANQAVQAAFITSVQSKYAVEHMKFEQDVLQPIYKKAIESGDFSNVNAQAMGAFNSWKQGLIRSNGGLFAETVLSPQLGNMEQSVFRSSLDFTTHGAREQAIYNMRAMTSTYGDTIRQFPGKINSVVEQIEGQEKTFAATYGSVLQGREAMEAMRDEVIMGAIQQAGKMNYEGAASIYEEYKDKLPAQAQPKIEKALEQFRITHEQKLKEQGRLSNATERVLGLLQGTIGLTDVNNKNVGEDVNLVFDNWDDIKTKIPAFTDISKEDVVVSAGWLPPDYASELSVMMRGTPQQRLSAAAAIKKIKDEGPAGISGITNDMLSEAYSFGLHYNINRDETKATEAVEAMRQIPRATRKELASTLKQHYKNEAKDPNGDFIKRLSGEVFPTGSKWLGLRSVEAGEFVSPTLGMSFENQADELMEYFYTAQNANFSAARVLTRDKLKTVWGTSQFLGAAPYKAYMPIESVTNQTTDPKIVEQNFKRIISRLPEHQKLDFKSVQLHYSGVDPRSNSAMYKVFTFNPDTQIMEPLTATVRGTYTTVEILASDLMKIKPQKPRKGKAQGSPPQDNLVG